MQSMWAKLRVLLGEVVSRIERMVEVRQRENISRFDIWAEQDAAEAILGILRRAKHQHRWWARYHINYFDRLPRGLVGASGRQKVATVGVVHAATWNIHSISCKRQELELYLRESGVKLLGLQETWRDCDQWPLHLKDYQIFESVAARRRRNNNGAVGERQSENGLALIIHKALVAYEFCSPSPYLTGVRVMMGTHEWYVINLYLPSRGDARRAALGAVREAVRAVFARDGSARLLLLGDWNTDKEGLARLLRRWRQPLSVVKCCGNSATFRGTRTWTSIDHMVVSSEARTLMLGAKVNRSWDLSDHWPLESRIRVLGLPPTEEVAGTTVQRLDKALLQEKREDILSHTIWDALAVDEDIEGLSDWFESATQIVAADFNLTQGGASKTKKKSTYRLSKGAKMAIWQRRMAHKKWARLEGPLRRGPEWARYVRCRKRASQLKRQCAQSSWVRHVADGAALICDNDLGGFWKWANQLLHRGKTGPVNSGPIFADGEGDELIYNPREKLQTWKLYYEKLLGDPTGHSRDVGFWELKFPGPAEPELPGLNGPIRWSEVNWVLGNLKQGKAPGRDGVPPEFYKLAYEPIVGLGEDVPSSGLGRAILRVTRAMWEQERIPEKWNEAWIVSILKKGDPKRMTNYRGISLIVVIVKILTAVILHRITQALEDANWLIPQQAGFRVREECAGHICALFEILQRREIAGRRTYVAFIDFEKAYDTVPIEGLLRKVSLAGVQGKCLGFLRSLYANARIRVRTSDGLSDTVDLLRGLRQGCNASPLLFDIFINDILKGCENLGVRIMGLDRDGREVGLLFADDLALICQNRRHLQTALELVQQWADDNEMRFGVGKCGIMGFGEGAKDRLLLDPNRFRLSGSPVPIVDSYMYLGLPFTSPIDLTGMAVSRAEKGRKVLNSLRGPLTCVRIPILLRVKIITAILLPVLAYGGELWGMSEERVKEPQRVLSEALRLLWKLGPRSSVVSSALLGVELEIPPVFAVVCAARARGYRKFSELRTTIAKLVQHPPTTRRRTWVTGTKGWLCRYCPLASAANIVETARLVKASVWDRVNKNSGGKSFESYHGLNMESTRLYMKLGAHYPQLARGFHWLGRLRLGSFWTAKKFVRIGWISAEFRTKCPFCLVEGGGEDEAHFLLECAAWAESREKFMGELVSENGIAWFNLLGGSREGGGLSEDTLKLRWCPRDNEFHPETELQNGNEAIQGVDNDNGMLGCVQVSRYLQHVVPMRMRRLKPLLEAPRADANNNGMAVLVADGNPVEIENVVETPISPGEPDAADTRRGIVVPIL